MAGVLWRKIRQDNRSGQSCLHFPTMLELRCNGQKVSVHENSSLWMWIRSRQRLERRYKHPEISLEYRRAYGNLGFRPERFGRFDLYSGWSNPVRASWVCERRIAAHERTASVKWIIAAII